ncbi:ArsB/NhaD family transporter [Candidatus Gracilibacteria bacterium]|nr:ArsB/NhaD family transporter [Candidatus Gracilibacteria bacterium]
MDFFTPFWISIVIFIVTFIGILSEQVHRSIIAFSGALAMAVIGNALGWYSFPQVQNSVDYNTLLLLGGMMILVAVMEKTGFFEYLAIKIAKKTHGSYWLLLVSLGLLTTLLSMILDNVTTIILIAPITLIITRILHFNPVPLLMSQAILSNIGGVGTLVGDPPNIIIGSAADFQFITFLTHSFPVVVVAWIIALLFILYQCHGDNKIKPKYIEKLMDIKARKSIIKPIILRKSLIVLCMVVFLFFTHHMLHIPASVVALLGAASILLLVAPHDNPQKYLKKLELSVFLFFASLFVLVGGLEAAGVLDYFASLIAGGVAENIVLTAIIVLWATALLSSIVDNIPMTIAMIPIITYLEAQGIAGTNILWWALVFGVGFGGNITPVGSTANIVVMAKLELAGKKIHTTDWMRTGVPVAFISLSVASAALMLFGNYFMN